MADDAGAASDGSSGAGLGTKAGHHGAGKEAKRSPNSDSRGDIRGTSLSFQQCQKRVVMNCCIHYDCRDIPMALLLLFGWLLDAALIRLHMPLPRESFSSSSLLLSELHSTETVGRF